MAVTRIMPTQYIIGDVGESCTLVRLSYQDEETLFVEVPNFVDKVLHEKHLKDLFLLDKKIFPEFKGISIIKSLDGNLIVKP